MLVSDIILPSQLLDADDRAIQEFMRRERKSRSTEADTHFGIDIINKVIKLDYDSRLLYTYIR